jgi:hypothetical protein
MCWVSEWWVDLGAALEGSRGEEWNRVEWNGVERKRRRAGEAWGVAKDLWQVCEQAAATDLSAYCIHSHPLHRPSTTLWFLVSRNRGSSSLLSSPLLSSSLQCGSNPSAKAKAKVSSVEERRGEERRGEERRGEERRGEDRSHSEPVEREGALLQKGKESKWDEKRCEI